MYNNKKQHENQKISKKMKIRVGAWPTHLLPSFSRIFGFFLTWQNPLHTGILSAFILPPSYEPHAHIFLIILLIRKLSAPQPLLLLVAFPRQRYKQDGDVLNQSHGVTVVYFFVPIGIIIDTTKYMATLYIICHF